HTDDKAILFHPQQCSLHKILLLMILMINFKNVLKKIDKFFSSIPPKRLYSKNVHDSWKTKNEPTEIVIKFTGDGGTLTKNKKIKFVLFGFQMSLNGTRQFFHLLI